MKSKLSFSIALVIFAIASIASFSRHQGISLTLISVGFLILSIATLIYLWELRNED